MKSENEFQVSDELIAKYLAGEASPGEASQLNDWLEIRENRVHFESLQASWDNTHPARKPRSAGKEKVWATLQSHMHGISSEQERLTKERRFKFFKIAAALLILIIAGSSAYFLFRDYNFSKPVNIYSGNELREMVLPDNSQVVLNRNSSITYHEQFRGDSRELKLSGEAFFNVATDPLKPFIIHTRLAKIQVLGTSFNVLETDEQLKVSVETGTVLVFTAADSAYLTSGHTAIVDATSPSIVEENIQDINVWSYATRKFIFKNTRLSEVFRHIERAFPYTIKVGDKSIENCRLTATFENTSVDYMVSLIAETLDLSVIKNDHAFTLEGNGCE